MIRFLRLLLTLSCLAGSASAADILLARWTFSDGLLKSDIGGFTLRQVDDGNEPTLTLANGHAKLAPRALLVCEEINSMDMPQLAKALTLWARIRIDAPTENDAFLFGLRDMEGIGNWRNMILAMLARPEPANSTGVFGRVSAGANIGSGPSSMVPVVPGRFVSVGMVFDGEKRELTYVVDGRSVSAKHRDATALAEFTHLAVGRLKAEGLVPLTIDELRVYSVALSPEWVAEISPSK